MRKLCTDEPWPIQHWGTLKRRRMTSTNGSKLSRSHQLMLKHRYRNYKSCTQSKEQSKSSNLKISSAANDDSCILAWNGVSAEEKNNGPEGSISLQHGPVPKCVVWCVVGGWRDMESQREDGCVHKAAKSCHRLRNGAWKNPQVSMLPALRWLHCRSSERLCCTANVTHLCTGRTGSSRSRCQVWTRRVRPETSPGMYRCNLSSFCWS